MDGAYLDEGARPSPGAEVGPRAALWVRVALVLGAALVVWLAVTRGLGLFLGEDAYSDRVGHAVRAVCMALLAVPLVVMARRHLDRRPWADLRLTGPREGLRWLLGGMLFWLVAALLGVTLCLGLGWARVEVGGWEFGTLLLAAYLPVLVFLFEALPEELVFRGYLYRNLADRYARWLAIVWQAVLFTGWAAVLGAVQTIDRAVLFVTFGLVLGLLRAVTGNLWACVGFHLAFQTVAQFDAAATRQGAVTVVGRADLDVVVYWFFPMVLGALMLVAWSWTRGRHPR